MSWWPSLIEANSECNTKSNQKTRNKIQQEEGTIEDQQHETKSSAWKDPIHGGRLRSNFESWKSQWPIHPNWTTINKTVSHTIKINGISIRNSTPSTSSERTGTNSGQSLRTTTQFPPKHQQICIGKLPSRFHTRQCKNFRWEKGNYINHTTAHHPRVEGPSGRVVENFDSF